MLRLAVAVKLVADTARADAVPEHMTRSRLFPAI